MLPASTPKVPLTVVANQGTEEMATTVQVRACKVFSLSVFFSLNDFFMAKKITQKMFRHNCNFRVPFRLKNTYNILFQTWTNVRSALTIVATMPAALIPKVPFTVVANQGTEEMVTTVQVGG